LIAQILKSICFCLVLINVLALDFFFKMNRVSDLNTIEIHIVNPQTHGAGSKKYTDYEVKTKVWF
jgi:hypothetical protein